MIQDSGAPLSSSSMRIIRQSRFLYGPYLFVAFDHQSLRCSIVGPDDLPDTSRLIYDSLPFPWGHKFGPDPQGDISFIIQDEMPDIAAAFMDDVNVRGLLLDTKPAVKMVYLHCLADPLPQSAPILCAPTSGPPHLGSV